RLRYRARADDLRDCHGAPVYSRRQLAARTCRAGDGQSRGDCRALPAASRLDHAGAAGPGGPASPSESVIAHPGVNGQLIAWCWTEGRMLWLRWKTFSGSYRSLTAVSRASLSG